MEIDRDYFIGEHVIPSAVGFFILAIITIPVVWFFSPDWLGWYKKILPVYYVLCGYRVCAKFMRDISRASHLSSQHAWLYRWVVVLLPGFLLWDALHVRTIWHLCRTARVKQRMGISAESPRIYVTVDGHTHAVACPGKDMPPMEVEDALILICGPERRRGNIFTNGNAAHPNNRISPGDHVVLERTRTEWSAAPPASARPEDTRFPPFV